MAAPEELRIEAQAVVSKLARDLDIDTITVGGRKLSQPDRIEQQADLVAAAVAEAPERKRVRAEVPPLAAAARTPG
jgi:transposase-like protein